MDHSFVPLRAEGFAEGERVDRAAAGLGRAREDRDAQAVDPGTACRGSQPVRASRPNSRTAFSAALPEIRSRLDAWFVPRADLGAGLHHRSVD
ncbi:hypothetical protein [Methylobacterium tardum]|uniref:hypothetical protein n=1 Tax=Methylobacterium tardum TaxID=374432 RepID=UPI00360E5B5F